MVDKYLKCVREQDNSMMQCCKELGTCHEDSDVLTINITKGSITHHCITAHWHWQY